MQRGRRGPPTCANGDRGTEIAPGSTRTGIGRGERSATGSPGRWSAVKKKAPEPANELVTTAQGTDAATSYFDAKGDAVQGELRASSEKPEKSREKAARGGGKREETARERAERIAKEADAWVSRHGDAWNYIVGMCVTEAEHKRTVSMQLAAEQVRKLDFASFQTPYGNINNKFRAALARRLVREHPEVKPYIELRRSALDLLDQEEGRFPDD